MATDSCLYYLEVLEDEHWALKGATDTAPGDARLAYVEACEALDLCCDAGTQAAFQTAEAAYRAELMPKLHRAARSALCFSGGGIRSATVGLGILQGLACSSKDDGETRPKLLGEFDFLSTVSGGGYLGSWFSAWAVHEAGPQTDGSAQVIRKLAGNRQAGFDPDPDPVRHLRAFSNYLTPQMGLFSGDTWAAIGSIFRNIFLNWLVLLPLLATVLLIPVGARQVLFVDASQTPDAARWYLAVVGFVMGALATAYVGYDLPSAGNARRPAGWYFCLCLIPLTLAAIHLNVFWAWLGKGSPNASLFDVVGLGRTGITWWHFGVFGAAMHAGGMLAGIGYAMLRFERPAPKTGLSATAAAAATGFLAALVAYLFARLIERQPSGLPLHSTAYTCLAFPTVMGVFLLGGTLLVGVTSYITEDRDREWWARSGGWLMAMAMAWPVFALIVLYSGGILHYLNAQLGVAFTAATGLTGWAAAKLGSSSDTPSGKGKSAPDLSKLAAAPWAKQLASRLVLPVFLVLLTMLLSLASFRLLDVMDRMPDVVPSFWPETMRPLGLATAHVMWLMIAYAVLCIGASIFINVNRFSLHAMYRQRLIRAYLGASNTEREPHWFTGFDENDNMPMSTLPPDKPLHVLNMSLNLVGGKNLAWQQRKAESFTCTRLHTGSCRIGYRPSMEYAGDSKIRKQVAAISLGTAMTISGAAASPNMGYNSSPLLTLVMMLFNARLGWWLGNPRDRSDVWRQPGPTWGIRPFIDEAFGLTTDTNAWVYLSDGAHFENLALYEMVLRRCKHIVVVDSGADPLYHFEDLGNAVRKIRIDFGIPIEFDGPMPMSPEGKRTPEFTGRHCATARIRYSVMDGKDVEDGLLIYIKTSLDGDEPADVHHYAAQNRLFPHQSTGDQFFNESQFESYRRLGLHMIEVIACGGKLDLNGFMERSRAYARSEAAAAPDLAASGPIAPGAAIH